MSLLSLFACKKEAQKEHLEIVVTIENIKKTNRIFGK